FLIALAFVPSMIPAPFDWGEVLKSDRCASLWMGWKKPLTMEGRYHIFGASQGGRASCRIPTLTGHIVALLIFVAAYSLLPLFQMANDA
ncbi:MAG: hypothetical protein KAQ78_11370, partial [Candidatus Latescibacteria bacterium]|nr:hypothetical protein [Candidatus Latescibacterota bacterium]